jgi:hypothetical protein
MSKRSTPFRLTLIAATVLSLLSVGAVTEPTTAAEPTHGTEPAQEEADKALSLWEQAQAYYELAKQAGESVPGNATDWLKQDYENIGDWEYKVVRGSLGEPAGALETMLNQLGNDRWELLWIQPQEESCLLFLKRPVRTWISTVPLTDLLKVISGGAVGGDGE